VVILDGAQMFTQSLLILYLDKEHELLDVREAGRCNGITYCGLAKNDAG